MPGSLKETENTLMMKLLFSFLGPTLKSFAQALSGYRVGLDIGIRLEPIFPSKEALLEQELESLKHFTELPALFRKEVMSN